MGFVEQLSCPACAYDSGVMTLCDWYHLDACRDCRSIVLAVRDPYRPLDLEFRCSQCGKGLGEERPALGSLQQCPGCQGLLRNSGRHEEMEPVVDVKLGKAVQVLRVGRRDGVTRARLRDGMVTLVGTAEDVAGLRWAEGVLRPEAGLEEILENPEAEPLFQFLGAAPLVRVELLGWLHEDPRNRLTRLELLLPDEQPWMDVDYKGLRALLEHEPDKLYPVLEALDCRLEFADDSVAKVVLEPLQMRIVSGTLQAQWHRISHLINTHVGDLFVEPSA